MNTAQPDLQDALARLGADSVYMLLHPGWRTEPRSNRWHFTSRWARHLPVVMVCPENDWVRSARRPEPRIPNCRILEVTRNFGPFWSGPARLHTAQILDDMNRSGARRPVLWLYNAFFAEAFAILPAAARVHHVTENYFEWDNLRPNFIDRLKAIIAMADLNVACSEGCTKPLLEFTDPSRIMVSTNGCDFTVYGADVPPDKEIMALREQHRRIAVFGGHVNERLDLNLIEKVAAANPDTLLLFIGANSLKDAAAQHFVALCNRPNVQHIPPINPDRLPGIYRAVDLGFIPETHDRANVENNFPVKTLEMAATGLPVVTSLLRQLQSLSPPLCVAEDDETFLKDFAHAKRDPTQAAELRAIAAAGDYDIKFSTIVRRMAELPKPSTRRMEILTAASQQGISSALLDLLVRDGKALRHVLRFAWQPIKENSNIRRALFWLRHLPEHTLAGFLFLLDLLPRRVRSFIRNVKRRFFGVHKAVP